MPTPYEVSVETRVAPARLWKAITDVEQIACWFGWDAETLADEIRFIFIDNPVVEHDRMRLTSEGLGGMYLEVAASGENSLIRAVQPGDDPDDGEVDLMKEGWIAFFHQLRRYVEDHTGEERRTLYLTGEGNGTEVSASLLARLPGEVWFDGRHTRVVATDDLGYGLMVLSNTPPLASGETGTLTLTLSTWGLSDNEFSQLAESWFDWWGRQVAGPELVTGRA
ncbi:MAG: hypothetical protein WBW62_07205 [Solirubrobacterales bacterium]